MAAIVVTSTSRESLNRSWWQISSEICAISLNSFLGTSVSKTTWNLQSLKFLYDPNDVLFSRSANGSKKYDYQLELNEKFSKSVLHFSKWRTQRWERIHLSNLSRTVETMPTTSTASLPALYKARFNFFAFIYYPLMPILVTQAACFHNETTAHAILLPICIWIVTQW